MSLPRQHIKWLNAGIILFADSGTIEINKLCRKVQLAKPSFYHIYPNWPDSKGKERFFLELLEELDGRLEKMELEMRYKLDLSFIPDTLDNLLKIIENNFVEFRCLAQLSANFEKGKSRELFNKHHNILCDCKVSLFHKFYPELPKETAILVCSSILISGYSIARGDKDEKKWKEHVLSVNKQLYQTVYND